MSGGRHGPPAVLVAAMDQRAACVRDVVDSAAEGLAAHNEVCHTPWCGMAGIIADLALDDELNKGHLAEIAAMAIHLLVEARTAAQAGAQ